MKHVIAALLAVLFSILASSHSHAQTNIAYDSGIRALREHRWRDAVEMFGKSSSSDAALYWRSYAFHMLGRQDDARIDCLTLSRKYPQSKWNDDCQSLAIFSSPSIEQRPPNKTAKVQGKIEAVHPNDDPAQTNRLLRLNTQLRVSPADGVAAAKELLVRDNLFSLKRHILFVLFQQTSPETKALVRELLSGHLGRELQLEAIVMCGSLQDSQYHTTLEAAYRESSDRTVKHVVVSALFASHDAVSLVSLVKHERDHEIKRDIASHLALMPDRPAIDYMASLLK